MLSPAGLLRKDFVAESREELIFVELNSLAERRTIHSINFRSKWLYSAICLLFDF